MLLRSLTTGIYGGGPFRDTGRKLYCSFVQLVNFFVAKFLMLKINIQ